ncbi:MAG: long-chain-fatty-acid--CoA ligase [Phycisphaeraceae bacterium]|nr:MAG: long-chain-fatty-acid--CoA ligase [Phycisphaeraceae bacterium]
MGHSVHRPIMWTLATRPRTPAVVDDRRTWRGLDLLGAAFFIARELRRLGAGGPVGIMVPTSGVFPAAALAAWILGRPIVPLNYLLSRDELQYIIDDADIKVVLTVGPMLDHLGHEPHAEHVVRIEDIPMKGLPPLRWPKGAPKDDLACLLYTSGTSGKPKGVELTHANLRANITQIAEWVHFTSDDVMLGVLPQFHSFGLTVLTLVPLWCRMKVIFRARFVPNRIVADFAKHKPTVFIGIPSMYRAMLSVKKAKPEDFTSLRYAVSGGEPLPDDVARQFTERFGVTIAEGFGMTECSPVTHWCRPDEFKPHSVGKALPRVEQRVVDIESGQPVGPEAEGELRVRGPNIMRGYHKLPDVTAETFDADGFLRTGDMARIDADGHAYITGRIKEMLIVGGENVFPREIEEIVESHPSVAATGVVGLRDPVRGEVPVAFVQLEEDAEFDKQALLDVCREKLAGYKVPREIRVLDELPRSGTGKVLRRRLSEILTAESESAAGELTRVTRPRT